jgi:hypothetical protein
MERCRRDYPAVVTIEDGRWAACWDRVPIAESVGESRPSSEGEARQR